MNRQIKINVIAQNLAEELLLGILKGNCNYSRIYNNLTDDEAKRIAELSNMKYTKTTNKDILFFCKISKSQISEIDMKLKIVTPYIVSLCEKAAIDRMNYCIDNNEILPEWTFNALERIKKQYNNDGITQSIDNGIMLLKNKQLLTFTHGISII